MGLFDSLLQGNSVKKVVGMAITPGIGLELVEYDKATGAVTNYGRRPLEYNIATREIQNYADFKSKLIDLVEKMFIKIRTPVFLILPNVYFDSIELPPDVQGNELDMAILSKAEEFYLFKREEPVSGWNEIVNTGNAVQKKYVYSSFQKSAIDEIKSVIEEASLTLVGIETSYSATLRGLRLSGLIDDVILEEASWTAMIIGSNNYTLLQMDGKNLINYSENPIAIKSFSEEEAYQAIVSNSYQVLTNFPSNKLFVISQADEISAEVLKTQMQFDREIVAIDLNKYSKKPIVNVAAALDMNDANSLTFSVLGATDLTSDIELDLNLYKDPNAKKATGGVYFTKMINGTEIEVTSDLVVKLIMTVTVAVVLIVGSIAGFLYYQTTQFQSQIAQADQEITDTKTQMDELSKLEAEEENKQEIDMTSIIDEVVKMNVDTLKFFDSISTDIPKDVWLTQYFNQAGTKLAVRGVAESIIDIYEYYRTLKTINPQADIKLTELKVVTGSKEPMSAKYMTDLMLGKDNDRLYSFEISNTQMQQDSTQDPAQVGSSGNRQSFKTNLQDDEDVIIRSSGAHASSSPSAQPVEQPSEQVTPIK